MGSKDNDGASPVHIATVADLVLDISHDEGQTFTAFCVNSTLLKQHAPYFSHLLDSAGFLEGRYFAEQRAKLIEKYTKLDHVPPEELPRVEIVDVGQISAIKNIAHLLKDFLHILHDSKAEDAVPRRLPLANFANLAIVADRFDALDHMARFARRVSWLNNAVVKVATETEVKLRQRLLIGLLLKHDIWTTTPSTELVLRGLSRQSQPRDPALWWDLPRGYEEELVFRHACIYEAIGSLQSYVLEEYTSRTRQCWLGYDSSPQCDAFQLGEFVRFLARNKLLELKPAYLPPLAVESLDGDIRQVISVLRQCPSYQIDANHSHCGPRKAILAGLDFISQRINSVGLSIDQTAFWSRALRPLTSSSQAREDSQHFFTATKRDWSWAVKRDGSTPG